MSLSASAEWLGELTRHGLSCSYVVPHQSLGRDGTFNDACKRTCMYFQGRGSAQQLVLEHGSAIPVQEISSIETHRQRPASPIFRTAPKEVFPRLATVRWNQTGQRCQAPQYVHVAFPTHADTSAFVDGMKAVQKVGARALLARHAREGGPKVAAPPAWQVERGRERFFHALRKSRGASRTDAGGPPTSRGGAEEDGADADDDPCISLCETPELHVRWHEALQGRQVTALPEEDVSELIAYGMPMQYRHKLWAAWVADPGLGSVPDLLGGASGEASRQIALDIPRTHPQWLRPSQRETLSRVLHAYAAHDPATGYCQGMNFLAMTFIIIGLSEAECFAGLCHMVGKVCPGYHRPSLEGYIRDCEVFGVLVHHLLPAVHVQLEVFEIGLSTMALGHFLTLAADKWPVGATMRLWDFLILGGTPALFASFLALLELYFPRASGTGFDVLCKRTISPGRHSHKMSASDLGACEQLCLDRKYGAFVVYRGQAFFYSAPARECRERLKDATDEYTLYLNNGTDVAAEINATDVMRRFNELVQLGARQELGKILECTQQYIRMVPTGLVERLRAEITDSGGDE